MLMTAGALLMAVSGGSQGKIQALSGDAARILKQRLVERINADRKQAKLPPLLIFDELSRLADEHCREMMDAGYVSHWNRAGQKSYQRYAAAGIIDHVAERIGRIKESKVMPLLDTVEARLFKIHDNFALEQAPSSSPKWTLLEPHHTHVGIGFAFDQNQVIMIEAFASRYVTLAKPLPVQATLSQELHLEGSLVVKGFEVKGLSVYYEPLPVELPLATLRNSGSSGGGEGFPKDTVMHRAILPPGSFYEDGTRGTLATNGTNFETIVPFFRKLPGVYTIVVWAKNRRLVEPFFMATTMCVFVKDDNSAGK